MADIVRVFQDIAESRDFKFSYGTKANINLVNLQAFDEGKTYLMMELPTRDTTMNSAGNAPASITYTGEFLMVKLGIFGQQHFNEMDASAPSKYESNIEPLITEHTNLCKLFACTDAEVQLWSNVDVSDFFDNNMDGLLCRYKIKTPIGWAGLI